jgi:hypothetical protein
VVKNFGGFAYFLFIPIREGIPQVLKNQFFTIRNDIINHKTDKVRKKIQNPHWQKAEKPNYREQEIVRNQLHFRRIALQK